ncbi:MAG: type 1 glutamine amidotransferase [Prevotellaceae bacterium]|nr:type 1 glutamine amidotransferase [Prevotellaceae bacterium]
MKINLLLCDWFEELLPDWLDSFPKMFYSLFDSVAGEDVEYRVYDVEKRELPDTLSHDELYVITGSMASVYEDKEWINGLKDFIRRAYHEKVKLVGVCFGHQAVAQALGGLVEKSPKGWGVGIRKSTVVLPEALKYFPEGELRLFYNHNDQVVRLPKDARLIATSDFCENEAFIIGDNILCFQGHPEYTSAYENHVLDIANYENKEVVKRGYETTAIDNTMGKEAGKWMIELLNKD